MITRVWHGRTSVLLEENYLNFLLNDGTKDIKLIPGNISIRIWKKKEIDCCHFYVVTEWKSYDSIKLFAGENYEQAVYSPQDKGVLLEFENKVMHYETYKI